MTLLYLAVAYLIGIALGRLAWDAGFLGCTTPAWWWLVPFTLLPFTPLLNRLTPDPNPPIPLRWPVSAGFAPPRTGWSVGLWAAVMLCVATGLLRYAAHPLTPCWTAADLATWKLPAEQANDRGAPQVILEGYLTSDPLVQDTRQRLDLGAERLTTDGATHTVQGTARLWTSAATRYRYGQRVRVSGRLVTPPELESGTYRDYLARQGIYSQVAAAQVEAMDGPLSGTWLRRQLYALRARGAVVIEHALAEPYAALAKGMLLGLDAGIPDELYADFNATGTSHVLVISGSNMALIAGILAAVSSRVVGRKRAVIPALLGITLYALLIGAEAPVLRAALMAGLVVVATGLGRRSAAIIGLAVAAWAMALINPLTLWDVGFQLSVAATAGLILFVPGLTAWLTKLWPAAGGRGLLAGIIQDGLVISLAATILVMPLVAYHFGRVSVVSLPANLLIAPVQPLILTWGSGGVAAGVLGISPIAQVMLWVAWLGLWWTTQVVEWMAVLPWASVEVDGYGLPALVITYALLFALYAARRAAKGTRSTTPLGNRAAHWLVSPALLGGLAVTALLLWSAGLTLPDGQLHIYFLDVGQGDGILIQTPSGRQVLVDGGSSPQQLFTQLGAVMPFWDRALDVMLLTHSDLDHMGAQVELPRRLAVAQAVTTAQVMQQEEAQGWRAGLEGAGTPLAQQEAGGWLDLGDGIALWVLWPPPGATGLEDNDSSLVTKLVYGNFSLLLTGDASALVEEAELTALVPLAATVLKVAHHGSKTGTTPAFVEAVQPGLAVIQLGADNRYGHPNAEVFAALSGRQVLRTDERGRIHLWTDGAQLWAETER